METEKLTIKSAKDLLDKKEISADDLKESCLKNIETKNGDLNAFLEVFEDMSEELSNLPTSQPTNLSSIPIAVKDNILIKGKTASAASRILENYTAAYDSTAIKKLKEAGAVFLGRTNMDEFAMGSSTENSAFGPTRNPHDPERVPGGSSGGSAAAVASGMALAALGSDTGGSVRQPASFCGVVGLKPTYGRVSRYGLMALGSSLDQIGVFAKTVEDAEIVYEAIKGPDPMDSTSLADDFGAEFEKKEVKTIGVPYHFIEKEGIDENVLKNFKEGIKKLEGNGFKIKEIELPNVGYSVAVYYIIMPAEASTNLSRYDGVKYGLHADGENLLQDYLKTRGTGFGPEPRRRIILGTYVLSAGYVDAYYYKANAVRDLIREDYSGAFRDVDVIATPTTPSPAFKIGEKSGDPLSMYLEDIFTVPANITGIPAISVPSGYAEVNEKRLPLGMQFFAPHGGESLLFRIGKDFEQL